MYQVEVKILESKHKLEYKSVYASGADIKADLKDPMVVKPHSTVLVPTGIFVAIPIGYEIQIRPRSGLAANSQISVLNTPGTIDCDYRGEIKVILVNFSDKDFVVNNGDRIAQAVLCPVVQAQFNVVAYLENTERGDGGFGHSGVK